MARVTHPGAESFVPAERDLPRLAAAAAECEGCDLFEHATQTVFGRGQTTARLMLVGEQPGDVEDTEGQAFVGPAGQVLKRAIHDADLAETPTYVTNAVKHFRWTPSRDGKRRIHEKPTASQSTACRPWLAAEIGALRPSVIVALGATAAASLFGPSFRVTQSRGADVGWPPSAGSFADDATPVAHAMATIHPSAVLRAPDDERDAMYDGLVHDLRVAKGLLPPEGTA